MLAIGDNPVSRSHAFLARWFAARLRQEFWTIDFRRAFENQKIWAVWLEWWQARVDGAPSWGLPPALEQEVETRIALGDGRKDFWDRDPAEVNAEIAGWVEEARRKASGERVPDWDYFISYSHHDETIAREIGSVLQDAGHTFFAQFQDFGPGTNLVREMQRGLANSGRLIALYSPAYEKSDHCQAEWSAAYNADPGSEKGKLLPFLLEPTELNPLARQIVYTSLIGLNAEERKQAILKAIAYKPHKLTRLNCSRPCKMS